MCTVSTKPVVSPVVAPPAATPDAAFPGRLAVKERVLASYRVRLFELIAPGCADGLHVATGLPRPHEAITVRDAIPGARYRALQNRYFLREPLMTFWQAGALEWLDEVRPDVLIVDANPRCLDTPFVIARMRRRGVPVIGWGIGTQSLSSGFESMRAAVRRRYVQQFDAIVAYSSRAAREYVAAGVREDRVSVACNAVLPRPRRALAVRAPFGGPGDARILFVGRLIEWKRLDLLLDACAAAYEGCAERPEIVVVGDGPMRAAWEAHAARVYPRTRFLGEIHGEALAPVFDAADLFVLPNKGGLAIHEAMGYGLPVIASDADGTELDLVRPGSSGWLIEPHDVGALARTLWDALSDPVRLRAMGRESYRIVCEEINLEAMAASLQRAAAAALARG